MQRRRNDAVLDRERRLDQPGDTRRRIEVTDIRLQRTDHRAGGWIVEHARKR